MVYRVLGLMSGSALDGLDIVFVEFRRTGVNGNMRSSRAKLTLTKGNGWKKLRNAINLKALDYQLLHIEYGHYIAGEVKKFIDKHGLDFRYS